MKNKTESFIPDYESIDLDKISYMVSSTCDQMMHIASGEGTESEKCALLATYFIQSLAALRAITSNEYVNRLLLSELTSENVLVLSVGKKETTH